MTQPPAPSSLRSSLRSWRRLLPIGLPLVLLALAPAAVAEPAPPDIVGVAVRVVDLDRARRFYDEVAGFEVVRQDREQGRIDLVNGAVQLWLLAVDSPVDHPYPRTSEGHLNIQIERLASTLDDLAGRGVPRLLDEPLMAAIGPNMPILDPSGNILYVVELTSHEGPLPRPRVFNFGLTIPDMPGAREFYEGVLGFVVYSEEYYPPVIPYLPAGALQVVLHEGASEAATTPPPSRAQMNLILAVDDLDAACRELRARGATVRTKDGLTALGRHAELVDPFGTVHVLVERTAAAPTATEETP